MIAWLFTFAAMAVADIFWAIYIKHVGDDARLKAAAFSVLLFLAGATAVIGYTENRWLLVPACAGCAAGTWIGMWWTARKKR